MEFALAQKAVTLNTDPPQGYASGQPSQSVARDIFKWLQLIEQAAAELYGILKVSHFS